jgi:V/A-type H+/Na+-transporting ATPase subunit E
MLGMAEKLDGLLNKIREEGLKKAENEKGRILSEAKAEAEKIITAATADAQNLRKSAEKDAAAAEKRAEAAIKQASRDILLSLRQELENRLKNVVLAASEEVMTPEFMGQIIMEAVGKFDTAIVDQGIDVMVSARNLEKMDELFKGSLLSNLKKDPELFAGHDFGGGLKLGFKGNDIFYDFSDEALTELICAYVGPRLTEIIQGKT